MRSDMNEQYAQWLRAYAVDKRARYRRIFKVGGEIVEDLGGEIDNAPARGTRDHHVSRLADLLCEASDGEVDRAQAVELRRRWHRRTEHVHLLLQLVQLVAVLGDDSKRLVETAGALQKGRQHVA